MCGLLGYHLFAVVVVGVVVVDAIRCVSMGKAESNEAENNFPLFRSQITGSASIKLIRRET